MAIQYPQFNRINYDEANPFMKGMIQGRDFQQNLMQFPQDLRAKILANEIAKVQAQYAPQKTQAEINQIQANTGLTGTEAAINRFKLKNPQYMNLEASLISQAMQNGGRQGQRQPQGQMPQQGQGYQPSEADQEGIANLHPGESYVIGGQHPRQPAGDNAYNPNAMAYNPPNIPSTGNPYADSVLYKKLGLDPKTQANFEISQKQAENYQKINNDKNAELNLQARFANDSTLNSYKFLDALDRVSNLESGPLFGKITGLSDARQEMSAYGSQMAAAATSLFKAGGAIHDSDIELQKMTKPNELQNKDVAFDLAHGVIAKNDRIKEQQQFYALGAQLRLKPEILDAMWNKYETDRPYIDSGTKMPNDSYKGTWKEYLSPQSINSFLSGEDYIPPSQRALQGMNWGKNDLVKLEKIGKKSGEKLDKKALYDLAKNEGITLAQLKAEFIKRGLL